MAQKYTFETDEQVMSVEPKMNVEQLVQVKGQLFLRIRPTGSRTYTMRYTDPETKRTAFKAIGHPPHMKLAEALRFCDNPNWHAGIVVIPPAPEDVDYEDLCYELIEKLHRTKAFKGAEWSSVSPEHMALMVSVMKLRKNRDELKKKLQSANESLSRTESAIALHNAMTKGLP